MIEGKFAYFQGKWYRRTPEGDWNKTLKKTLGLHLNGLLAQVPDAEFWRRTRRRMSTEHGLYQIIGSLERAFLLGVVKGFATTQYNCNCLCGRSDGGCYREEYP